MSKHSVNKARTRSSRRERVPEDLRKRIGDRIRKLRESRTDFTQGELAKRAGVDPASMNQIENAKRLPSLASVLTIAAQIGVPCSAILDDSPNYGTPSATVVAQPVDVPQVIQSTSYEILSALAAALLECAARQRAEADARRQAVRAG